ncbi:MAG: phosphoglycerate dehydrogenase [Pseudobdellovibrionaceae bacterium]
MEPIKILLVENIHPVAKSRLEEEGFQVDLKTHSPNEKELIEMLQGYQALGIRSKTEITRNIFEKSPHLMTVGCFCIGTNQVDVTTANRRGVPVFNAPYSNTRSVAEMVIAEMIALSRQLGDRSAQAHQGEWVKSAEGSREVRGKTLGIIGYGHIGSQVSILAEALGMKVLFFDILKKLPLGNAQSVNSLEELLMKSDFVTLHVPETPQTKDMMSARVLKQMKKGAHLINASRGTVVVIEDLVEALKSKHLAGCAIDVFPVEPASNKEKFVSPLQGVPNVILTPHVGGSTEEAQYAIGLEVAESFTRYLKIGSTSGAVNFPIVDLPVQKGAHRILNVHRNEPGVLGEINSVVSEAGANILAQYLSTDQHIGYLVMDVEKANAAPLCEEIKKLSRSIRTRIVY